MTAYITVVEGEDIARTVLSLQFVYKGSRICKEYGCFISGAKTLKEVDGIMNEYGMFPDHLIDSPSIVMLDAEKLGKITLKKSPLPLDTLVKLLKEIHKDINFTRLSVDRFDLLSGNGARKSVKDLFIFTYENDIKMLLTVNAHPSSHIIDLCDNHLAVKKGHVPLVLFS